MIPKKIILHHSLTKDSKTVSWNAIRKYHLAKGWDDIGYHYGIEKIGLRYEILVGRLMNVHGAHTKGQNNSSIGICLVGNFDINPPHFEQWNLAVSLVQSLCEVLFLTRTSVFGHTEFAPYKTCPGKLFNMNKFKKEVI